MDLHSNNFWKIINAESKNNTSTVDINNMLEFLKGMNEYKVDDDNESLPEVITEVNVSDTCN